MSGDDAGTVSSDAVTVGIDATTLLGARTGVGVTVAGMVASLSERRDVHLRGYGFTATGWAALRKVVPTGVGAGRAPMPAGALLRVWARTSHPAIEWWTGPVDVVHGTNFVVPPTRRAGRLVTVADLTAVRFPEMCTPTSLRYPALIARALAEGAMVHTGATTIAAEIVEHFGVSPERVRVVAPGIDAAVQPLHPPAPGPPYILGLGTVEPRKDFPGLVRAFDLVADRHPDLELRLVGRDGWGSAALDEAVAAARHRDRIRRLGWVDDPDAVVAGASVFAYPSVYEGFGLPPLEAMARRVPVVATTGGAIPEVVGDAARLVPVGDVEALAGALDEVLDDSDLRATLVAAGLRRVARYRWSDNAAGLAAIYHELAGRS